ncbi:hypothetical protein HD554DRAFT_2011261 [Boletus coccyginus]|nr:hypothetical protein HD554DRAFT_2011261 [Boletus coccyginus]
MNSELAPCFSTPELLASPPTTPPRGHKHSFSKPMSWLNRSSSSTSSHFTPHAAPKPTRISEPKGGSSLEQFHFHRSGPLGSGATIVRTPQEALSGSTRPFGLISEDGVEPDILLHDTEKSETRFLPSLPPSPPLPPLPDIPHTEGLGDRLSGSPSSIPLSDHAPHPRSLGSQSPAAHPSSQPTLLAHPHVTSRSIPSPPPVDTDVIPPQPPFEPILLSPIPDGAIDPSKLIVTLETCTTTFRTSLRSLVSRPSHLSRYITSLLSPVSETASIYSNTSDASSVPRSNGFNSVFRDHLASSGFLSQPSTGIHVFLDRPSAPYAHVLAYLRSLPSTPGHPEALPRAVQLLGSATSCRFESLLELCDEARYLGLAELEKLCCYEMHRFQRSLPSTSACGLPRGQTGSVHSSHTLVERCQSRQEVRPSEPQVPKGNSGGNTVRSAPRESSSGSSFENKDAAVREQTRQGRGFKHEAGPPPPGWI